MRVTSQFMILSDHDIKRYAEAGMIIPWDPQLLNPASLDLTLGNNLMIETQETAELIPFSIQECTQSTPFLLQPGQFVLAETVQTFSIPVDIAGLFFLKSSRARSGLEHLHAGFADPGWNGSVLTMELFNSRTHHPLALYPGMRIGQMVFFKMSSVPSKDYSITGRYNGNTMVTPGLPTP